MVKIKKIQQFLIFKITKKSSLLIKYLGILKPSELDKYKLSNINYITPGRKKYELLCLCSNEAILSIIVDKNGEEIGKNLLRISNLENLLNLKNETNHEISKDILDFKPIYLRDLLIGVVLIENSVDIDENLWLFYKKPDNNIVSFSTFVENELFIYYDYKEVCHLFFLQEDQLWFIKFEKIFVDNLENFADIISLREKHPYIHDIFFYRNTIYIRTNDFLHKYHSEYLTLENMEKVENSYFVKQSHKSPHILICKKGRVFVRNDPETEPYFPIFINLNYEEINFEYEESPKFINLYKSDLIIIKTKKEIILVSLFFDTRLTYIIKKKDLKKINFFEELAKRPKEFRERIESQLGFLKRSVEIEIDSIKSDVFKPPRLIQFFTKEDDIDLLNNLYNKKTYDSYAKEWKRNPPSIYFHVKRTFDIPRCQIHTRVKKTCKDCLNKLKIWRDEGLKKVETIKYRESLTTKIFSGAEKDYYITFIKRRYFNRIQRVFEFYEIIPQELWNKTIDYVIPLSMEGHSFELVLGFGLHEILENHYNNKSYDSVINDPMFRYFLIIDREFHKYWKPKRIAKFMQKHNSHIKTVEKTNRILRTQQLFVNFIYPKINEDFSPFFDLLVDKLSHLLKTNLLLSNQPKTTIVAGLFGKLYKLFPTPFNKKYTQSEISIELQTTEVTLRKATKDIKNASLDTLIINCWNSFKEDLNFSLDSLKFKETEEAKNIEIKRELNKTLDVNISDDNQEKVLSIEGNQEIQKDKIERYEESITELAFKKKIQLIFTRSKDSLYRSSCGRDYRHGHHLVNHYINCPECSNQLIYKDESNNYNCRGNKHYRYAYQICNHIKRCNVFKKYLQDLLNQIEIKTLKEKKGTNEEALERNENVLNIDPQDKFVWLNKGLKLHEEKNYIEAIECYEKALEIDPMLKEAWYLTGLDLEILEKYDKAIECYEKALEIDPRYRKAWFSKEKNTIFTKGLAMFNIGNYEKAIDCFERVLEFDPEYKNAWYFKGLNLETLEKYEEAIACYDKALKIDPEFKDALNNKRIALDKLIKYENEKFRNKKFHE